jgi:uncharacterized membrane protein YeaQ/YmgE (transglycosylase-associated protein family)
MRVTDWVSAILVGIVVGILGRLALPGRQRIGAFATFLIGVAAALLGTVVARWLGVDRNAPAHLWALRWDWVVLAIQVGFAIVGIGLANVLTYTKLAGGDQPDRRRRTSRRRTSRA